MLIWLDDSLRSDALVGDDEACVGLSAVLNSAYRGEHYVLGARATLATLAKRECLSPLERKILGTIHANLSTSGAIANVVSTRLVVALGIDQSPIKNSDFEWTVSVQFLGKVGVRKAVLVAENLDDAKVFEHAARHYQAASKLGGKVVLEGVLGGGSTTPAVLENIADNEKRWCLCITDSDRLCPDDSMDLTARKCRKIASRSGLVACHVDMEVREIENSIPLSILSDAIPDGHRGQWDWHVERLLSLCPNAHKFCDMKSGTTRRTICSYPVGSPRRAFWDGVANVLVRASALRFECLADPCPRPNGSACECMVTKGFGENLLGTVLLHMDRMSPHEAESKTRRDPLRPLWMDLGKSVYEWACAPSPRRV